MITCPRCGEPSVLLKSRDLKPEHMTANLRECSNGHQFSTREVHVTMLADERERRSARNAINHRLARWNRDAAIVADKRPVAEIAEAFGITPTRVRQIRASRSEQQDAPKTRRILSSTQKGKS